MNKQKIILTGLAILLLSACATTDKPQGTLTPSPTYLEPTATAIPPTFTLVPTLTARPSPTPSLTPLPTYSPLESQKVILELLETNADCKLPCWWGFTPGETRADVAFNFISSLNPPWLLGSPDESEFTPQFDVPPYISSVSFFDQHYYIQGGLIEAITVGSLEIKRYSFQQILADYGIPDEVWVNAGIDAHELTASIHLAVLYSTKGILVVDSINGKVVGENIRACLHKGNSTVLGLWEAGGNLTIVEVANLTHLMGDNVFLLNPLQEVTDLSVEEFYLRYREEGAQECLEVSFD